VGFFVPNCPHGTTKQIPAELHTQNDPEIVKAARGKIKDHAKKLIVENQQKFPPTEDRQYNLCGAEHRWGIA
jgi:hypothetical protein